MRLMVSRMNGVSVLATEGELTTMTAVDFLRQARSAVASSIAPLIALDLGRLGRIDSTGCAALLQLRREIMGRRGHLCLFRLGSEVRWLIEVMQAHVILDIAPDLPGALEALGIGVGTVNGDAGTPGRSRFDGEDDTQQLAS